MIGSFACSFKPNVTQSVDSWVLALKVCCFPADEARCQLVARILSDNGLHNVDRFLKAAPIGNWVKTNDLSASERTALCELARLFRLRRKSFECVFILMPKCLSKCGGWQEESRSVISIDATILCCGRLRRWFCTTAWHDFFTCFVHACPLVRFRRQCGRR